jgi:DNA repair protein RecN (Recombination protein N)
MLTEYISEYLLKRRRIAFDTGMSIITGETGAGKSVLVGSIALIFGDKSLDPEPYDPALPVYLEASFNPAENAELKSFLANEGYENLEELVLAREHNLSGRSQYYLNGRKIALSFMKELKPLIIDFHHQRDQQKLLGANYQLELLDSFGDLGPIRERFAESYRALRSMLHKLQELKRQDAADRQLRELYQYQFEELDKAKLQPDEDKVLQAEFDLLSHSQEIRELAINATLELTEDDGNLYDRLRYLISRMSSFGQIEPKFRKACEALGEAQLAITEAAAQMEEIGSSLSQDPSRLDAIQTRLDLINSLIYKHKVKNITELNELFALRQKQLDTMDDNQSLIKELEERSTKDFIALLELADDLSEQRIKTAAKLSKALLAQVRELSIPKAELQIQIDKKQFDKNIMQSSLAAMDETGQDSIELLFSANPGSAVKPLASVASGGELSRVLLAIKKVLSERMPCRLIILDEIDSGIGGKTAEQVASYISQLGQRHRVLCITHLAQLAVAADSHIAIEKFSENKKTLVKIIKLADEDRQREVARMLSGSITELSLLHAKELIEKEVISE